MAEQDNTFLTANDIYEDVEGETGKKVLSCSAIITPYV